MGDLLVGDGAQCYRPVMYPILLQAHSLFRWVVLVLAVSAVVVLGQAARQRDFGPPQRFVLLAYVISLDLMLVLGLGLYITSPLVQAGLQNMGLGMKDATLRRFIIEHPFSMVIAIALAHVGNFKSKKEPTSRRARTAFVYVLVSFIVILLGMPWSRF